MPDVPISVALCTCDGARHIEQQVRSIIEQTCPPCEIVVCDDCSTDHTVAVLSALPSNVPLRIYRNEKRLGVSANFQKAVSLCQGELIALSDQDDRWHPEKLAVLGDALLAAGAAYAYCDAQLTDAELRPSGHTLFEHHGLTDHVVRELQSERSLELLSVANYATGACMLFRRQWLTQISPFSGNWIHDGWIALMLSAFSFGVPVPRQLVDYRQHAGQALGACMRSEMRRFHWQRLMNRKYFHREAARWRDAYLFLRDRQHLMRRPGDLELIRRRAMLDRDRLSLRDDHLLRWEAVHGHLLSGDYQRYAHGRISAAMDLLWPE